MKKIAFFDFDGTITDRDTLLEIIKFQKGRLLFYTGFLLYSPWLVAYKLKIIRNDLAKQRILRFFFGGLPLEIFQERCDAFATGDLPSLIRPGALLEIKKLQAENVEIVIVSASADNWISAWTKKMQLQLIATALEVNRGHLTGHILGQNCHGEEKVRRIRAAYDLSQYAEIYAYGDSSGDRPMLALATHAFYKPFRDL